MEKLGADTQTSSYHIVSDKVRTYFIINKMNNGSFWLTNNEGEVF